MRDPRQPGLNFELLGGLKGVWSIRVNDNFRILLSEREDKSGTYFLATHLAKHDIYKRL
jgi:plasmid maintenance system killer protein